MNDNRPRPANDNRPPPGGAAARTALRGLTAAGRLALRAHPFLNAALLAYDLYELYRWYEGREGHAAGWDMTGWEKTGDCGGAGSAFFPGGHTGGTACLTWAVYDTSQQGKSEISPPWERINFLRNISYPQPGKVQGARAQAYRRPYIEGQELPQYYPESIPDTPPAWEVVEPYFVPRAPRPGPRPRPRHPNEVFPSTDPLTVPGLQPRPTPRQLPYKVLPHRRPNPYRDPREQTETGPKPVRPESPLVSNPTVVVTPRDVTVSDRPHVREPPRKDVKERKAVSLPGVGKVLSQVFHSITEFADVIDALFDALPKKTQKGYKEKGLHNKAEYVWDHANELDINKAIENLVKNHIEDKLIGALNAGVGRRTRRNRNDPGGLPVGWGFGPAF